MIATLVTSRGQIGIKALELATTTYQQDNEDLRGRVGAAEGRVFAAEQRVVDLTAQVNRCEGDKSLLAERVHELERRLGL